MEGFRGLFYYNDQYRPGHIEIVANLEVPIVKLGVPIGISAIDWIDVCWIVIIDQWNRPEPGSEGSGVIRVPNRNWFLEQMGVIVGDGDGFFHLLLPDNRGIAHQLLIVLVESLRWRVRSDVLSDRY